MTGPPTNDGGTPRRKGVPRRRLGSPMDCASVAGCTVQTTSRRGPPKHTIHAFHTWVDQPWNAPPVNKARGLMGGPTRGHGYHAANRGRAVPAEDTGEPDGGCRNRRFPGERELLAASWWSRPYGFCMTDESERAVEAAVEAELRLLDPEVRAVPTLVSELLDPQFTEIGASGRRWDAASILTVTSAGTVSSESPVKISEMSGVVLAPGVVHLTYFADNQGRRAWRSSLWRLTEAGWRMYFHQGTLAS